MTGEKQVREECKEPTFYTINCNREELMGIYEMMEKKKKIYDRRYSNNSNTMLLRD